MYRAILVESEVHLSLLPIPNSLRVRFLIRRFPPDASVTQFPIPEDTDYGFKIHAD